MITKVFCPKKRIDFFNRAGKGVEQNINVAKIPHSATATFNMLTSKLASLGQNAAETNSTEISKNNEASLLALEIKKKFLK